mmetsp:Transcript_18508/g.36736  ORF Transcript_18508/g.36736 Transcript_18508/m.36736 type:complete len:98 (-) Transcript_18508:976-1269(-)
MLKEKKHGVYGKALKKLNSNQVINLHWSGASFDRFNDFWLCRESHCSGGEIHNSQALSPCLDHMTIIFKINGILFRLDYHSNKKRNWGIHEPNHVCR